MTKIRVALGDIVDQPSDTMILKYAERLYGADRYIAGKEGFSTPVPRGEIKIIRSNHTAAGLIAFFGVGNLYDFDYENIRNFARQALSVASSFRPNAHTFTITSHGPGYGLDEKEAFLSLIEGLDNAFIGAGTEHFPNEILIVEKNASRQKRYEELLARAPLGFLQRDEPTARSKGTEIVFESSIFSSASEKPKVFLAMPFAEKYEDEFSAIREACETLGVLCERIDMEKFSGDILERIKKGIRDCDLFAAVLNENNPNVFLEIGYAWGIGKKTLLIMRREENIPFDVRSQRIVMYEKLFKMRDQIKAEIATALELEAQ